MQTVKEGHGHFKTGIHRGDAGDGGAFTYAGGDNKPRKVPVPDGTLGNRKGNDVV